MQLGQLHNEAVQAEYMSKEQGIRHRAETIAKIVIMHAYGGKNYSQDDIERFINSEDDCDL
jgi:hypothetical protein